MSQPLVTVDETTYRIYPRQAPEHNDLDGLEGHTPSAVGWPVGKMARTNGDGEWEIVDEPTVDPYTAAGSILGVVKYNPATVVNLNATTTITEYDPARLQVSFTVPASGKVLVDLSAAHFSSTSPNTVFWLLRQVGAVVPGSYVSIDATSTAGRRQATILVEGLTPGASVTFVWAGQTITGTSTLRIGGGDTAHASNVGGAATMIVRDAPF